MQPYKFNMQHQNAANNPQTMNIRKINPNQVQLKPMSRGSGAGMRRVQQSTTLQPDYTNPANQSIMSGGSMGATSGGNQTLPELVKVKGGGNTHGGNRGSLAGT